MYGLRNQLGRRMLVLLVLVGLQAGLFVHYGWQMEQCPTPSESTHCPEMDAIAAEEERFVGERVIVSGTVISTNPLVIEASYLDGTVSIELRDAPVTAEVGSRVSVYGTLQEGHVVDVEGAIVHPAGNRRLMFVVSFAAILLTTVLWFRYWTVDTDELAFVPRGDS